MVTHKYMCDTISRPLSYNDFPEMIVYWTKISYLVIINLIQTYHIAKQTRGTHVKSIRRRN
jgi:hypothetical protein